MTKVNGYELDCPICRGKNFSRKSSMLNSRGMTLLGLDWANQGAINFICDSCGYIFWFIDDGREFLDKYKEEIKPEGKNFPIDYETSKAEEDECPICFNKYNKSQKECTNCGYTFK
jgi:predicted nucleic-acid-binding Zn-ribbon protein